MSRTERRSQTSRADRSRATGKPALANAGEPRTSTPCCRCCTYAATLQEGSRELLVCMNCPERPGRMRVTDPSHCCRVFQKRRPRVHRKAPPEPLDDGIRHIPLTKGRYAIIDAADFDRVARFNWCASVSGNRAYAYGWMNGRRVSLHRFLANAPQGMVVDHIDHNGLNDRRSNLRICTVRQNLYNSRPWGKSSRFKGVCWNRHAKRWVACIWLHGRNQYLGQFTDEIEAARAYDRKAYELFGKYAYLNFPEEIKSRS